MRQLGVACRKIGTDMLSRGASDADIVPLLLRLKHPTFFTHDADFWDARLCHAGYCLAFLDVRSRDAAAYVRRFLRHGLFDTFARRSGKVLHIHAREITYYSRASRATQTVTWASR